MHYQVVVIGAGPAGLACAKYLSQNGIRTLLLEKKQKIGSKVCAGGITWGGMADKIPQHLVEKAFPVQHIKTRFQSITVCASHPIIVTISREKFGRYMLEQATSAGVHILSSTRVTEISNGSLTLRHKSETHQKKVTFDYLVGADGSNSFVRRYLALRTSKVGIGLNYQIEGDHEKMEWHLNADYFKNGYGWIFPHRTTISIGAYVDASIMKAQTLKQNLFNWAKSVGIDLLGKQCRAEYINFDYQGWDFGRIFLAGDAAGFASGLTGEGIYPAIVSGETIAKKIIDPDADCSSLNRLIKKHNHHRWLMNLTGKNPTINLLLSEILILALRCKFLNFRQLEMAD